MFLEFSVRKSHPRLCKNAFLSLWGIEWGLQVYVVMRFAVDSGLKGQETIG